MTPRFPHFVSLFWPPAAFLRRRSCGQWTACSSVAQKAFCIWPNGFSYAMSGGDACGVSELRAANHTPHHQRVATGPNWHPHAFCGPSHPGPPCPIVRLASAFVDRTIFAGWQPISPSRPPLLLRLPAGHTARAVAIRVRWLARRRR